MKLKTLLATAAAAVIAATGAFAEGTVGIAMPTKSSARWISDGNSMVEQFKAAGYETGEGFVKLPYDREIPEQVSRELLRARLAEFLATGSSWSPR